MVNVKKCIYAKSNPGFTLIELMLGVAILAFVLSAVIFSITSSAAFSQQAKDLTISTAVADAVMDEIFNEVQGDTIEIGTIQAKDWVDWVSTQGLIDSGSGYSLSGITATLTQDGSYADLYNVRVTVSWDDNGNTRSVVLNSKVWDE